MDRITAYVVCWLSIISIAACWKTSNKAYIQLDLGTCDNIVPERFKDYEIVTDSIPKPPPCLLKVEYRTPTGLRDIFLGNRAYELELLPMPVKVVWPADDSKYYSLVMYDLDAPSRSDPKNREVILWMVINIPGNNAKLGTVPGTSADSGQTLVEYIGPRPASGTGEHRIVWLVYSQGSRLISDRFFAPIPERETEYRLNFLTHEDFILENSSSFEQTSPVAGNFVLCSWKEGQPGAGFDDDSDDIFSAQLGLMSFTERDSTNSHSDENADQSPTEDLIEYDMGSMLGSLVEERFEAYSIVPDSIPAAPPQLLEVLYKTSYGRRDIFLGNYADELDMASLPMKVIMFAADESKNYTLIMYDLDSPSRANPANREVILWMVLNVPGKLLKRGTVPGISPNSGKTLIEYIGPRPASGTGLHRIVWLVYLQKRSLSEKIYRPMSKTDIERRLNFHVHEELILPNKGDWERVIPFAGNFVQCSWKVGQPGHGFV